MKKIHLAVSSVLVALSLTTSVQAEAAAKEKAYMGKKFPSNEVIAKNLQRSFPSNAKVGAIIGKVKLSDDCSNVYYHFKQFSESIRSGSVCKLDTNIWLLRGLKETIILLQ